ncbi:MAG TPA: efflux RND transporter periplasmic adaptor subunit, partial [Mucilaginibacter sp.]|nr:efflux RND transporter periplasmic adaptor subunit [Mucilaginibacter sp.]
MKKIHLLSGLVATALLLSSCKHEQKATNALGEPDIIPVKVSAVSLLEIPGHISATGLVSTEDEARYSFKIGGVISRIFVEEGQFFKKGQLL